ncbi:unnamed protein product [Cuscuta epithymum]|uniref:Uncharacterized protein n=1 Tax=Cuscuta epithymum TaxID=186058 RepID=A0AAV0GIE9_9ASTE|nr:unnamed protein product [Cuscuta epithymum]
MNGARAEDFRKGYQNTINSSNGAQKEPMHQRHENITSDSGDFTSHTVVLCFGEAEYREKNFSEDSCLLDILAMCHKLVDIYSVGIKITDGNGRPLKCDQDVANMLKEHQGLENIIINLYKDDTIQPLSYKLPQHNTALTNQSLNQSNDMPKEAHVVHNTSLSSEKAKGSVGKNKTKKVRGINKCKEVANLKKGEKLKVRFYNKRVAGENHKSFSRHLGKIIRNRQICPLTVTEWANIDEDKKDHMWAAVTEVFEGFDLLDRRDDVLSHMRELWNKWRGWMHFKYVKKRTPLEALKKVPPGVTKEDWGWLIKNYYFTPEYKAKSERGSKNRSRLTMLHRMGSKPIRELIFQMGGKDDNPPNMDVIFYETRKKKGQLVEPETIKKYEEIHEVVQSNPSLPHVDVIEKCFGPQQRSHVICFGGGVSRKDLKGPSSKKSELEARLQVAEEENRSMKEENQSMKSRLSTLEDEFQKLKEMFQGQGSKV